MTPPLTVLVLMGGRSSEHEVSLVSARGVMAALDPDAFSVVPVEIATDGSWLHDGAPVTLALVDGRPVLAGLEDPTRTPVDVVFPVLHGPFGEDGTVQGLCEMVGVPYVGAGVAASAVSMDKVLFKTIARQHGLPVADAVVITPGTWAAARADIHVAVAALGFPVFVKPARLGSSVGISRVVDEPGLDEAVDIALTHDDKVLVERGIVGREVEVGILDDGRLIVSPPGEIRYTAEWYDYETKYHEGRAELQIPADLPLSVVARLQDVARTAYEAVGCHGMGRIDCFVTEDGDVVVSEINTIPGFTPTSAYPSLMAAAGITYPQLVARLVRAALERAAHERALRR
jgi:D-alanine-D-alanine ligase